MNNLKRNVFVFIRRHLSILLIRRGKAITIHHIEISLISSILNNRNIMVLLLQILLSGYYWSREFYVTCKNKIFLVHIQVMMKTEQTRINHLSRSRIHHWISWIKYIYQAWGITSHTKEIYWHLILRLVQDTA